MGQEAGTTNTRVERVKSPCIGTCLLDPSIGGCIGCYRTVEEITIWKTMTDAEKLRSLRRIEDARRSTRTF